MAEPTNWYWCLAHDRVERADQRCSAEQRLGPYPTEAAARDWRSTSEARNEAWDEADAAWEGEDGAG